MRKHSKKGKARAAESVDDAKLARNTSAEAVAKKPVGEGGKETATKAGKTVRTARATAPNQQWLREIAKTAASVRWKRGD